jgi:hypothetical protein
MTAKNLISERKGILRNQEIRETNSLIELLIKGNINPDEIKVTRSKLDLIQARIEELEWVLQAK